MFLIRVTKWIKNSPKLSIKILQLDLLNKIIEFNISLQLRDKKVRWINLPKLTLEQILQAKDKFRLINLNWKIWAHQFHRILQAKIMQKLIILQREIKNLKLEFYKEDKKKELKNKKRIKKENKVNLMLAKKSKIQQIL